MSCIEIANIVGTLDFHRELDLSAVGNLLRSVDEVNEVTYLPAENHWLQTKFNFGQDQKYVAFYRSGTCAIVGCDDFTEFCELGEEIKRAMSPVIQNEPTLQIKNIVCVGEIDRQLDLANLAISAGLERVEYEPEQFSGLIYRDPDHSTVLLVFASGKVVITGSETVDSAEQSFQSFVKDLDEWESEICSA